jgi:hypothetical protein
MSELDTHYIYLLQEREFRKTKENIYKIGKTMQSNNIRFLQYPKGSILLLQLICLDCNNSEVNILKVFKDKYIQRKDIGNEYFEGDYISLISDIFDIISLTNSNTFNYIPKNKQEVLIHKVANICLHTPQSNDTHLQNTKITDSLSELIPVKYGINKGSYYCKTCNYKTYVKQNYNTHLQSSSHKIKIELPVDNDEFTCINCNKLILSRTSFWRHNKKCKVKLPVEPSIVNQSCINEEPDELHKKINKLEKIVLKLTELI